MRTNTCGFRREFLVELELQVLVDNLVQLLEAELRFLAKATSALNC